MTTKRKYNRRTDEERIADLEQRIEEIREREKKKQVKTDPVVKEIPKVQRRLQKFAQLAMDHSRPDIANTTSGFIMTLERILSSENQAQRSPTSADA